MRCLVAAIIICTAGCFSPTPPAETPRQKRISQTRKRPEDLTGRILMDKEYPDWLKRNYAEWIRYAYDLEEPSSE
jgi:hypothetical protein